MTFNLELAQKIVYVYLVRILASIGILGNLLNLVILRQRTLHDSPYTYLKALAIADLFVLIIILGIGVVRCGDCELSIQQQYWGRLYEYYIYLPLINMAGNCSVFVTVAMTVERFLFVRLPLSAKTVCHRRRARRIICGALLLAAIINVPRFFLFIVDRVEEPIPAFISIKCSSLPTRGFAKVGVEPDHFGPKCFYSKEASLKALMAAVKIRDKKEPHEHQTPSSIFLWRESPLQQQPRVDQEKPIQSSPTKLPFNLMRKRLPPKHDLTISKCDDTNDDRMPGRHMEPLYFNWTDFHLKFFRVSPDQTVKNFYQRSLAVPLFQDRGTKAVPVVAMNITDTKDIQYLLRTFPCITDTKVISSFQLSPWNVTLDPVVEINTTPFNRKYRTFVHISTLVFEGGGFFAMAILNVVLIYLVRKRCRERQRLFGIVQRTPSMTANSSSSSKDQIRLTVTLVSITALTMVGCILSSVSNPLFFPSDINKQDEVSYAVIAIVTNVFMLMSHSINFLVYALINRRFRTAFCNVFLCRKRLGQSNRNLPGKTLHSSQSFNNNAVNNNNNANIKYINLEKDSKNNNVTEDVSMSGLCVDHASLKKINDVNTLQADYYKFDCKL